MVFKKTMGGCFWVVLAAAQAVGATVIYGDDVPPGVAASVRALLGARRIEEDIVIGNGSAACWASVGCDLRGLPAESYVVRRLGTGTVCALGNGADGGAARSIGSGFAAYDVLERLGYSFAHPLAPTAPTALAALEANLSVVESPRLRRRILHVHTQHPLESVELLNGGDAVLGDGSLVAWESMVWEARSLMEWATANRQNGVEWALLHSKAWDDANFTASETRQRRLRKLTALAQSFGLAAGVDVPLVEVQQNAWAMTSPLFKAWATQRAEIEARADWLLDGAGFDFVSTESGFDEFFHPSCSEMLRLMDALANYTRGSHGKATYIKVHSSAGQTCDDYLDPETGLPVDFNFLPQFAEPSLGVLPHPVQAYALDDPTGGTYGNQNYSAMASWLAREAAEGARDVVFHPETNYWVNVDVDVPLFLPLYGRNRLRDLDLLDAVPLAGQNIFDSGWEWGAWLSDVVAARAAWRRPASFRDALRPVARALGSDAAADAIAQLADDQHRLLVLGGGDATQADLDVLSGFGYMSGRTAWTDLLKTLRIAATQPDRVEPTDHAHPLYGRVAPLLADMAATFSAAAKDLRRLAGDERDNDLLSEVADATEVLALRATFVDRVYAALAPAAADSADALAEARAALDAAAATVRAREANYRVPVDRVGAWRETPTAYGFGYLWSVKSLFYWWRDYGKAALALNGTDPGPCYLNEENSLEVAFGADWAATAAPEIRAFLASLSLDEAAACFSPPKEEYVFPRDLFRYV